MTQQTGFGFERVSEAEKTRRVRDVFNRVAQKYDLMNDLMSLGIHRLWKSHLVWGLNLSPEAQVLDAAGGTGDISFRLRKTFPHLNLHITICDITLPMMEVGRDRAINQGFLKNISWICGNLESLPFADESMDLYIIAYGLRNVTRIPDALAEAFRVLKPGGRFVCLEFSRLQSLPAQKVYDFYSFNVLPALGRWVAQDREAYQYLVESIRTFPDQESLNEQIKATGFSSSVFQNLWRGISCIHTGIK